MFDTRRKFLVTLALGGASAGIMTVSMAGQDPKSPMQSPNGAPKNPEVPEPTHPTKAMLEAADKDIKKKVDRLFELASELKQEVEKTDSTKVLSIVLVKKSEEIEKLAKEIKNLSKG